MSLAIFRRCHNHIPDARDYPQRRPLFRRSLLGEAEEVAREVGELAADLKELEVMTGTTCLKPKNNK
jgi:hypothetical protein